MSIEWFGRRGAVSVSTIALFGLGLAFGAGSADATAAYCRTDGTLGDATVHLPGVVFAQLDTGASTSPTQGGFWLCVIPPEQGVGVGVRDLQPTPGVQVGAESCGTLTTSHPDRCVGPRRATGAEVDPVTALEPPNDGNGRTGATVGAGPNTCVYADSWTPTTCTGPLTVASVTIAEGDVVPGVGGTAVCVGRDAANPTVSVNVIGSQTTNDIGVAGGPRCVP